MRPTGFSLIHYALNDMCPGRLATKRELYYEITPRPRLLINGKLRARETLLAREHTNKDNSFGSGQRCELLDVLSVESRGQLDGLLVLRCIAASMIVLFHLAHMPSLQLPNYLQIIPRNFGMGVPIFYVVSAFSLCVGYYGKLESREELRTYFVRRFCRIAPLFYVFIVLYFVYLNWEYGYSVPMADILTSATFTFNLVPGKAQGFVWASWSIGVEMAFYAVFPLMLLMITTVWRSIIFFLFCSYLSISWQSIANTSPDPVLRDLGNYSVFSHLHTFAGGIAGYYLWKMIRRRQNVGHIVIGAGTLLLLYLIFFSKALVDLAGPMAYKIGLTISFSLIAAGVAADSALVRYPQWLTNRGRTSFGLYLAHPLVIGFLMNRGLYGYVYSVTGGGWISYAVCAMLTFSLVVPAASLAYRYVERPGSALAGRILRIGRVHSGSLSPAPEPART